ncbi:MAG: hypothetical protein EAX96_04590 [Candidatus Lokiarchaeota archaeon]|nr:hypothetical protein [Candidatus Lokiarchaeota archaeon]
METENIYLQALLNENEKVIWRGKPSEGGIKRALTNPNLLSLIITFILFLSVIIFIISISIIEEIFIFRLLTISTFVPAIAPFFITMTFYLISYLIGYNPKFTEYYVTNEKIYEIFNGRQITPLAYVHVYAIKFYDLPTYTESLKDTAQGITLKLYEFATEDLEMFKIENGRIKLISKKRWWFPKRFLFEDVENWKELDDILKNKGIKLVAGRIIR